MLPTCLTTSFALYIAFYRGNELTDAGLKAIRPNGDSYTISDGRSVLEFYLAHKDDSARDLTYAICQNTDFWDEGLSAYHSF